ncbi:MAG: prepilin-type N-terminal cleavage/methylation domain-containing protein [Candidatus Competibacterales bacterium]|nr:prepilin-type N-terminal cleavage/methylation domain-containing protein [Candidatus Competibacterales bacterium]
MTTAAVDAGSRGSHAQCGFTLLELLIAMSLLGLLVGVLYGGLDTGIRSWERGLSQSARVNEMRLVSGFLRTQLRQSRTVYLNDPDRGRVVFFDGTEDSLGWVAPMLGYLGRGGLYDVRLDRIEQGDEAMLRLRWRPYRLDADLDDVLDPEAEEETVLLEQVSEFVVRYYGSPEPGQDPSWQSHWDNPAQRPALVSIALVVAGRQWPTLDVALSP